MIEKLARQLPESFEDLEYFVGWALPQERQRMTKRWTSDMEDLRSFYNAMSARIEDVLAHLDKFNLKALPEREARLLRMTLSMAEASSAVEVYGQPTVKYGFPSPDRYVPGPRID